jgi:hypothetical protein
VASIKGWNLAPPQLPLDTQSGDDCIRQTAYHKGKQLSNSIAYAVDTLPECEESESNDTIKRAQQVELPEPYKIGSRTTTNSCPGDIRGHSLICAVHDIVRYTTKNVYEELASVVMCDMRKIGRFAFFI